MSRRLAILAATLAIPATGAGAVPAECAKISNDLDRLACYDREVGRTPVAEALAPKGRWEIVMQTSKMTDQKSVLLSVFSDETVDCGWNKGAKIELQLRCHENKTAMLFNTNCHMVSSDYNDYGDITYRIDTEKARTVGGDVSTDSRTLGLWTGAKSIPVIKQMFGKTKIIARMTPFGENPFTATFHIAGTEQAVEPLRKACGW